MRRPVAPADAPGLRAAAEAASGHLPALVLAAERLAATVTPGAHGLRRAGAGEDFWQYRPAHAGDAARAIDWRRSARSDAEFVRDREAQTAQSAAIWVSSGQGMDHAGGGAPKRDRARLIALALAMLLLRGGERVAMLGQGPRAGRLQAERIAGALLGDAADTPPLAALRPMQRVVLISDFLDDPAWLGPFLDRAAGMGTGGLILQVLAPDEAHFPFDGAVEFRAGPHRHLTRDAGALREAYLARLAERQDWLAARATGAGWLFRTHLTDADPATALAGLWAALDGGR